ncbi:hypothetical protein EYZ11_000943 [Aspergillus tanneri]|uniref:Uncharacterized protein n=1 Tax=Aspergillus tanneri TaxID=1220188 RepID=A0A4S3JVU0_9EURO|nr:hypothetical protein EYZ11_000943 [Aspergillus tanneri]
MATHVVTTTKTSPTTSAHQISLYGHASPVNSTNTTANSSPTSPQQQYLPLQTRQLRPPKAPLYVPAALRPTERPQKPSLPTPPRSVHGSLDSLNDCEIQESLSRRSTMESVSSGSISKKAEDEWMKNEHLGEVTGLPTRDHWKADSASPNYARFHPEGVQSRACDLCWIAYQRWEESRTERLSKIQSQLNSQPLQPIENPTEETRVEVVDLLQDSDSKKALAAVHSQTGDIAASIPRGWNWSTF